LPPKRATTLGRENRGPS
jgi:hypothetical protein